MGEVAVDVLMDVDASEAQGYKESNGLKGWKNGLERCFFFVYNTVQEHF